MTEKPLAITRKRDRLEAAIRESLTATGSAINGPDDDPDLWRRCARKVARELGRPVRTLMTSDGAAHAGLTDWPATPEEEAVSRAHMRAIANAVSLKNRRPLRPVD